MCFKNRALIECSCGRGGLEEWRYKHEKTGNDSSPLAVAIILNCDADKMPPKLETLVRAGIETGAALSGTVQTENIGFEKMVCNIVANPDIRYLIVGEQGFAS